MQYKIFLILLMVGLWAISSTCQAQQWTESPAGNCSRQSLGDDEKSTLQFPEEQIIRKEFEVTDQWQTITFEKPLQIKRNGIMGLHLAVDKQLYITTMHDHPLNPKLSKRGCTANDFCLRRLSDGAIIRPEVFLIADHGAKVSVKPAGHLYPNFDKGIITIALRTFKDANSPPPPFPAGIMAFKAMRIRSAEPFLVRYLYWNVDRYPCNNRGME